MVKFITDHFFDMTKIRHHAILVEILCTTVYCDYAIVPMQTLAFAFVVEFEIVGKSHFQSF